MFDKNLIDLSVMSTEQIDKIIRKAKKIMQSPADYRHACDGKILATLFYEPSTRTQRSFQTAMLKPGGRTIGFDNPMNSSDTKGESLKDTITIVGEYADIIAMRHPVEGTAAAASLYAGVPDINCGDGGHLIQLRRLPTLSLSAVKKADLITSEKVYAVTFSTAEQFIRLSRHLQNIRTTALYLSQQRNSAFRFMLLTFLKRTAVSMKFLIALQMQSQTLMFCI